MIVGAILLIVFFAVLMVQPKILRINILSKLKDSVLRTICMAMFFVGSLLAFIGGIVLVFSFGANWLSPILMIVLGSMMMMISIVYTNDLDYRRD